MSDGTRTIITDLLARDKMGPAFDSASKKASKAGAVFGKVGGVLKGPLVAGAAVAGAGVAAFGGFVLQGLKDAASYQTVLKKTGAVLKSTGNLAGTSVEGVKNLAAELESVSGVDEELIINSQNLLATFTNIRNVGKNKIFDQATQSALDMSVALGTDLKGASVQLGKALNDPIKGITALSRSGVSFTEGQKDTIKSLVKSGKTMEAQKLILRELNKEFGGAAKAAGSGFEGSLARAKDALSDTGREIGIVLLPKITALAEKFAKALPAAVQDFKDGWNGLNLKGSSGTIKGMAGDLNELSAALGHTTDAFNDGKEAPTTWGDIAQTAASNVSSSLLNMTQDWNINAARFKGYWVRIGKAAKEATGATHAERVKMQAELNRIETVKARAEIDKLQTEIRHLKGKKVITETDRARIRAAQAEVDRLRGKINSLKSRTIRVGTIFFQKGKEPGTYGNGLGVLARAKGGPVTKGQPYVVGEHRPELFIPEQNGRIEPDVRPGGTAPSMARTGPGGGGGTNVTYVLNVHAAGASPQQLATLVIQGIKALPAGATKIPRSAVSAR